MASISRVRMVQSRSSTSAARQPGRGVPALAAALVSVRHGRVRLPRRQPAAAVGRRWGGAVGGRGTGAHAGLGEPVSPGRVGQVVAVVRRRRPDVADSAVGRARGRGEALAGRGVGRYLLHLRQAGRALRRGPALALDRQDVLITVPHRSTRRARADASRRQRSRPHPVTLLEEPQAACYAWIDSAGESWRRTLRVGDLVLGDIGGGTIDFSLILVSEHDGDLALERAIGDHILLGGDNMDLALARVVQQRLQDEAIASTPGSCGRCGTSAASRKRRCSRGRLRPRTRSPCSERARGSSAAIKGELRRDDLTQVIVDGFFPKVAANEMPARRRRAGLQELGLPYAAEPGHHAPPRPFSRTAGGRRPVRVGRSPRAERHGLSDARALQRRRVESGSPALADHRRAERLAGPGTLRAARCRARPRRTRSRSCRGARRRLLRTSASQRTRRADSKRRLAELLHRHRERAAGGAGLRGSVEGPLRRSVRDGGGNQRADRGPGIRLSVGEPAEFRFLSSTIRKGDPGAIIEDWGTTSRSSVRSKSLDADPDLAASTCATASSR